MGLKNCTFSEWNKDTPFFFQIFWAQNKFPQTTCKKTAFTEVLSVFHFVKNAIPLSYSTLKTWFFNILFKYESTVVKSLSKWKTEAFASRKFRWDFLGRIPLKVCFSKLSIFDETLCFLQTVIFFIFISLFMVGNTLPWKISMQLCSGQAHEKTMSGALGSQI